MACIYDYTTGDMSLDFHVVKENDICTLPYSTPARIGGWSCQHCQYFGGSLGTERFSPFDFFYKCKHPEAKNSTHEDAVSILSKCYDRLEHNALCALDG